MLSIRTGPTTQDFRIAPVHYSCTIDTSAGEQAALMLEAMEDRAPPVRLSVDGVEDGDVRGGLWELAKRWLSEF